jgi:hypothetical protein
LRGFEKKAKMIYDEESPAKIFFGFLRVSDPREKI